MGLLPRAAAHEPHGAGPERHAEDPADRLEILEHGIVPLVFETGPAIPGAGLFLRGVRQLFKLVDDGLDGAGHGQSSGNAHKARRRFCGALQGESARRGCSLPPVEGAQCSRSARPRASNASRNASWDRASIFIGP